MLGCTVPQRGPLWTQSLQWEKENLKLSSCFASPAICSLGGPPRSHLTGITRNSAKLHLWRAERDGEGVGFKVNSVQVSDCILPCSSALAELPQVALPSAEQIQGLPPPPRPRISVDSSAWLRCLEQVLLDLEPMWLPTLAGKQIWSIASGPAQTWPETPGRHRVYCIDTLGRELGQQYCTTVKYSIWSHITRV